MDNEQKEKMEAMAGEAKKKAVGIWTVCKEKIAETWKSGPKGKAICIGGVTAFLLVVFLLGGGKKEEAKPDASELLAKQLAAAQAEMQRIQAETQAKIAAENAAREAEAAKRRTEEEARRAEKAAESEANQKAFQENLAKQQEEMQRQYAEVLAQTQANEAERQRKLAERDRQLAEAAARQKEIAAEAAARVQANREKAEAKRKAMEDARNHVPAATGTLDGSALSEKDFSQVFIGDAPDDEGTIYAHGRSENIRVYQSTSSGLLVGYEQGTSAYAEQVEDLMGSLGVSFDRVVWVDTKTRLNEENRPLRDGFYVRKGMHSYIGTDGGEHVLAQYIEITDPDDVKMLKAEQKRRAEEKRMAEEEAAELANERGAYELNLPLTSLCGFKLGAPPSQVKGLLLYEDGSAVRAMSYRSDMFGNQPKYRLAKPFRLFTHAEVSFADRGVGKHLESVELTGKPDLNKYTSESYFAEVEAMAQLIEKKFGIQFQRTPYSTSKSQMSYIWRDGAGHETLNITATPSYLKLYFADLFEIRRFDAAAKEASKTDIQFDADAGADQL